MTAYAGIPALPHISGGGFGFLNMLHAAAMVPNKTDYREYTGHDHVPHEVLETGEPLRHAAGRLAIPAGPGLGVHFDPEMLAKPTVVST